MQLRSLLSRPLAEIIAGSVIRDISRPLECQEKIMKELVKKGWKTIYGKAHRFNEINSYADFTRHIPLCDYEEIKPYIERISSGEKDILWPGLPIYFAKTSGTTSGIKYIPITSDSISNHIDTARNGFTSGPSW